MNNAAVTQSRLSELSALAGHALDTASYKLAPVAGLYPAAYWSYIHMTAHMGVDDVNAKIISASIEIVGIVSVNTAVRALERGRNGLSFAAFAAFLMYVGIVVLLNFIVSAANALGPDWRVWAVIFAAALMALMGVPSAIIIMVESQLHAHDRKIVALEDEKAGDAATLFDQQERAKDNDLSRTLALRAAEAAEAEKLRAERRAEAAEKKSRKTSVETSEPKFAEVLQKSVSDYRNKTEAAAEMIPAFILAHGREPKLAEISAMLQVGLSQASGYMKPYRKTSGAEAVTK